MAVSSADCDKMISAAVRHNVKLCVMHNERFYPPMRTAERLVHENQIGDLIGMRILSLTDRSLYMENENHWAHRLPTGILGETAPHAVYLSLAFLNKVQDVHIRAENRWLHSKGRNDTFWIELVGENATSSITISHAANVTAKEVDLIGAMGVVRVDLQAMILTIHRRRRLDAFAIGKSSLVHVWELLGGIASNSLSMLAHRSPLGHYHLIREFVKSVQDGKDPPISMEEGRETVRIMESIGNKVERDGYTSPE